MNIIYLIGSYVLWAIYIFAVILLLLAGVCMLVTGIKGIIKLIKEEED